jgi:hypothetical protein
MKKYIVETSKSSKWIWEVLADSEDEAKYNYEQGFVVSKNTDIKITVSEA